MNGDSDKGHHSTEHQLHRVLEMLDGVDRIFVELHDHVTGLSGVGTLFRTLAAKGFVYDPRHSAGSVILFQRLGTRDIIRPYAG